MQNIQIRQGSRDTSGILIKEGLNCNVTTLEALFMSSDSNSMVTFSSLTLTQKLPGGSSLKISGRTQES